MPKAIQPTTHALIDCAIAGSFLLMAARFWRRNRRAAAGALLCGGVMAANVVLTDYPGGALDVLSYRTHGRVDGGLAGLTAAVPRLMGFSEEPEARAFTTMALAATLATSMTEFSTD
ncbi:MAG: hypothetical protein WA655_02320 [Candidatus Korobacteraceae bacterium]